jgi:hypothetical protein
MGFLLAKSNEAAEAAATVTEHELEQVGRANASGRSPVVFGHALWLLPTSWATASRRRNPTQLHRIGPIDNGWREVADTALAFVKRFT